MSNSNDDSSGNHIVNLNVGGRKFSTSTNTLTWIPDTFFSSLLSGRIPVFRDEDGAIFIDRDPDVFRVILNYLRTKQVDLSNVSVLNLKHEAQFFGLEPLVRRLALCEELEESSCGNVLFHGMIQPPFDVPKKLKNELRVRMIRSHNTTLVVGYSKFVAAYKCDLEYNGWTHLWTSQHFPNTIKHISVNSKINKGGTDRLVSISFQDDTIQLWSVDENRVALKIGEFLMGAPVDHLFFVGTQMVALSKVGKVGIWHSATQNWQSQEMAEIFCYDTAGSSLLLGCTNGSLFYIDMQKFPLRMKDNDLLVTELYKDPSGDCITAISVFLTPKTSVCGNWIEIAYGTAGGTVRVIVQHPETVGHGPQLFQTYNVHNSAVIKISLTTGHLISVCSEYNHVRTWIVTRFRGMISTQPGTMSLSSFKVLTIDGMEEGVDRQYSDPGPHGEQDSEQVFIQRLVPNSDQVFVRIASTGERICIIKSVDKQPISAFSVHECDGTSRIGNRPRRFLFCGCNNGSIQMWDLTTALDQYHSRNGTTAPQSMLPSTSSQSEMMKPTITATLKSPFVPALGGPTPQELLNLIDECEICSTCSTPNTQ